MRLGSKWGVRVASTLAIAVACTAFAASAHAEEYPPCTTKPTPEDVDGAKGAHKAATQFYERTDYARAIQYWRDAYTFDCTAHGVLLNLANAYEKKGDKPAAALALETYLQRVPDSPEKATLTTRIEALRAAPVETKPAIPETTKPAEVAPKVEEKKPAPTAKSVRPYGTKPLLLVGAGAAVLVGGAILLPVGASQVSTANSACPGHVCKSASATSSGNSGRTVEGIGAGAVVVGGVALAAGLVWQFGFNKKKDAPAAASFLLAPSAGPGSAGLLASGSF